ncbi:MAG: hypothetical protein EZS28_015827 [Streblomastix strix]|uniref:Uncharacterized protein n=1 Tax=Streblomastix strix TaxID=222440 RepID=A0A5J4W123_9EUKA|nr:MAG: hypothetical protein EZS28_015827 [Streblomastix strix]
MSGTMKNKSHFVLTDEVDQVEAGSKTFSNNVTAPAFVKSGGINQQILMANGLTKPLSEFGSSIDAQNYVDKSTDQIIDSNKVFSLEIRAPTFKLSGYSSDYLVMSGSMKNKSHFILTDDVDQTVTGTKTCSNNVTAPVFVKSDGTDQQVLLANGSTKPLSDFSGGGGDMSNYVKKTGAVVQVINGILRKGEDKREESEDDDDYITKGMMIHKIQRILRIPHGAKSVMLLRQNSIISINIIQAYQGRDICTVNPPPLYTILHTLNSDYMDMFTDDGYMKQTSLLVLFLNYKMSNVYIDEALLDAAELLEFPELYVYIHEREPKLIVDGIANQIIIRTQYHQDQVKDNDDKLNVYQIPQPIVPIEIPQFQIFKIPKRQLAKKLYNIGLYLSDDFMGFVFTNFLEELQPFSKHALVLGDDDGHKQNEMGYISEKQFYLGVSVGSLDQVTSIKGNTQIAIAGVYYTDYEPLKSAISDVKGDGKINIVDDWHVKSIIDGMKTMSWVQDVVQNQTEAIGDRVQPYDPSIAISLSNNFNKNTKLVNNNTFGRLRAAYLLKKGSICNRSYLIDPQSQESNLNNITLNGEPISHIDSVIMQHDTLPSVPIPPSVFPQDTVIEVSRDQLLVLAYTLYDLDAFKIYIIDDSVKKLVMFNMHLRQKGFIEVKQYVLSMSESIDPKRTQLFAVMILYEFNTDPIQDILSACFSVADADNPVRWYIHISSKLKADKFVNYFLSGSYFV